MALRDLDRHADSFVGCRFIMVLPFNTKIKLFLLLFTCLDKSLQEEVAKTKDLFNPLYI